MVSYRCKVALKKALDSLGINYGEIFLGEAELKQELSQELREELRAALTISKLELLDDKKAILIEKIKSLIIEKIHYSDGINLESFPSLISYKLDYNYNYLANLFTEVTGTTIEQFIITHKIEKVKELLLYNELNLTEISYVLNYSSVAHLSGQFKKITGLTPSYFKKLKLFKKRIGLDEL